MTRNRCVLASLACFVFPGLLVAQARPLPLNLGQVATPTRQISQNQKMANTIAENLRQSGQLHRYDVNILFLNGIAELTGQVADVTQRDEVLRLVHSVPGVEKVRDQLVVAKGWGITPTQLAEQPKLEPGPPPSKEPGYPQEPTPIFQAMPGALPSPAIQPPTMPPHAWPTFAPYNNYSRVAYPTIYPYNAWPFIGPFYPFPKVPLGWRSVSLKWNDGYWWYGRHATGHDWWRVRYR